MDRSLPGSSTHGIFQARVLKWVAVAFSEYKWIDRGKKEIEDKEKLTLEQRKTL